jgi:hypothetical protein
MKMKYGASIVACLLVASVIPLQAQQTETNQTVNNAKFEAIKANADKGILYPKRLAGSKEPQT